MSRTLPFPAVSTTHLVIGSLLSLIEYYCLKCAFLKLWTNTSSSPRLCVCVALQWRIARCDLVLFSRFFLPLTGFYTLFAHLFLQNMISLVLHEETCELWALSLCSLNFFVVILVLLLFGNNFSSRSGSLEWWSISKWKYYFFQNWFPPIN